MKTILFINHRTKNCGVQQFFKRLTEPALTSVLYSCNYIDIDTEQEAQYWIDQLQPASIVWNFYTHATMPWMSAEVLRRQSAKNINVFHEVPNSLPFDAIVHQDPTDRVEGWLPIARPIPLYYNTRPSPKVPTFGSFGFGLGGKGFSRIIEQVQKEYDEAVIKINIPFAAFGDADGRGAKDWATDCRTKVQQPGIKLHITHDFFEEHDLLDFLAGNTCNCFFYDANYGRGLSGTLDYALAVDRPIAITSSFQFQHFWKYSEESLIEKHTLRTIIAAGTAPLEIYHRMWGYTQVKQDWEAIFNTIVGV